MRPRQSTCKHGHQLATVGKRKAWNKTEGRIAQYDRRECRLCKAVNSNVRTAARHSSINQLPFSFGTKKS